MRALLAAAVLLAASPQSLRFGWPERGGALVETIDARAIGSASREIRMETRLAFEPGPAGGLALRFSGARIVSLNGVPAATADPTSVTAAAARVMKVATPDFLVSPSGRYVRALDAGRATSDVAQAAGFPVVPAAERALAALVEGAAASDWTAWSEAWLGDAPAPGEWTRETREMDLDGERVEVVVTRRRLPPSGRPGCARFELTTEYPSSSVRRATSGFLLDLAIEAKEIADDVRVNTRFLERATFGPIVEHLVAEIEIATLRPIEVERTRTFSASAGRHRVEGREVRTHRFTWDPDPTPRR